MPRTFSFIAALAAALAVAVPTAAAEGQPTGSYRWATETVAQGTYDRGMPAIAAEKADLFTRIAAAHSLRNPVVDDRFRIDPTADAAPVAASSGRNIEGPGIGIGVALLIALGLGAYLVARSRQRPLAH
jgi:hypothetical protein